MAKQKYIYKAPYSWIVRADVQGLDIPKKSFHFSTHGGINAAKRAAIKEAKKLEKKVDDHFASDEYKKKQEGYISPKERRNIAAWKKANPSLKYDDLSPQEQFQVRLRGSKAYSQLSVSSDMVKDIKQKYLDKKTAREISTELTTEYKLPKTMPPTTVSNIIGRLKKEDVKGSNDKGEATPKFTKEELKGRPTRLPSRTGSLYDKFVNDEDFFNKIQKFAKTNDKTRVDKYVAKLTDSNYFSAKEVVTKAVNNLGLTIGKRGVGGADVKPEVTANAKKLLKLIEKNPQASSTELQKLSKFTTHSYNSALRVLQEPVSKRTGETRVKVPSHLSKIIAKKGDVGMKRVVDNLVDQKVITKDQGVKLLNAPAAAVRTTLQDIGGSVFEHAFPENLTQYLNDKDRIKTLKMSGSRTSPFLNYFKIKYDVKQDALVRQFLADEISLAKYNSEINKIRDTVRKATGGYEVGYIKFDSSKNPTAMTKAKPLIEGDKLLGPASRQKASFYENAQYTSNLLRKFKNNPDNPIFASLASRVAPEDISDVVDVYKQAVVDYNKAKPSFTSQKKLVNFAQKNLDNTFVQTLFKTPFGEVSVLKETVEKLPDLFDGPEAQKACSILFERVANAKGPGCGDQVREALQNDSDGFLKKVEKLPAQGGFMSRAKTVASNILNKIPKGGRLGAILAGAGAVGAGTWAMMGDAEAGTTDQMTYNATTGQFDDAEGEPETQEGILNWIADNPIKSGLAPIPIGMGAGLGAEQMGARNLGKFFTSMKFMLPPAYAAEKLYQYKEGQDLGEMFTNPLDAVWAMALDTPYSAAQKMKYYKEAGDRLGLKHLDPRKWRETGAALKRATMAPASRGTRLVFPFGTEKFGFGAAKPLAKTGLPRALGIGARMLPLGPIPLALVAGSMAWDKYKFNQKVGDHVDALRAKGIVSEEDAETMNTIYKQGWLGTTALGAKLLGSEELMFEGEMRDLDYQKMMLDEMKDWYEGREKVATKERVGDRQEDFFSWFSKGGRVGVAEGGDDFKPKGGMTRRTFLKWLVGSIATGVAAVTGKGIKQAAKPVVKEAVKAVPSKFAGVEGMPAWFPRAVYQIKTHGKLIEMADKHYVGGDIYEMMIPVTRRYMDSHAKRKGGENVYITKNEYEKVIMEENPLTGEINLHWTGTDNFGDDAVRQINFRPGSAGYQKFGVDPEHPQAWEYQRVKVEDPEFSYSQPDQSQPYREDIEYLDIFEEGDEIVEGLEKMTGQKNVVTKDGTVMDLTDYSKADKEVDEAFEKKIYRDLPEDEALLPDPEGSIGPEGDWLGDSPNEMIGGDVPDWLPKDEWPKKAEGGIIETGNIARRPGAVPPLSGPDPEGIMSLYSNPKQVKVG